MKASHCLTAQPAPVDFEDRRRRGFGSSATLQLYRVHRRFGTAAFQKATAGACSLEEQERWEEGPPGNAGVPPACNPVAYRSISCDAAPRHPAGGNGMGSAEAESWPRCRSTRVEELAEAVPRLVRAGRPRSRVGFIP